MYYLFRLAEIIIPRLPRRLVRALGNVAAFIAWLVAGRARRQATENMMHVLGGQDERGQQFLKTRAGHKRLRQTVRGMFRHNVSNYLDLFLLPMTKPETILQNLVVRGQKHLKEALALGKGLIMFSGHFGPFDYLAQWLAINGYQVVIPVEHLADQRVLDLMLRLRRNKGVQFVPLGGTTAMRSILQALRNNQIVLITADRAVQGEKVTVPFFGAPARLPLGIVQIAQRTGAPIVAGFGWRTGRSRMPVLLGDVVPLSLALPQEQRKQTEHLMSGIVAILERFIGEHPEQWVVFSPVWITQQLQKQQKSMWTTNTSVQLDEEQHDNEQAQERNRKF
jgi:KDO2-lipid IV(A) lauroyltransferase